MVIKQFKNKPVVVNAMVYDGTNFEDIVKFTKGKAKPHPLPEKFKNKSFMLETTDRTYAYVYIGDYVVEDECGKYYSAKPNVFLKKFEEI